MADIREVKRGVYSWRPGTDKEIPRIAPAPSASTLALISITTAPASQPHVRTAPNKTKNDNWSTRGNVNPRTGKEGTRPRDDER